MINRRTLLEGLGAASAAAALPLSHWPQETAGGFGLAQVKAEGTSVPYDPAVNPLEHITPLYADPRLTDDESWYLMTHRAPSYITSVHRGVSA